MTTIRESIRRLFIPFEPLPAGLYHYQAPSEAPDHYRLHLRIEQDGSGVLIVNASTILHLNTTATEYAYHLLRGSSQEEVARAMAARYHASQAQILHDFTDFKDRIETLISTTDLDPVTYLDFERRKPHTVPISAPYRLDCALTYRLPDSSDPSFAPTARVARELTTLEWETIMDKAWQAGIPHIVFTGGEPTLRDDFIQLITHAESNGQVTGLLTDGIHLAEPAYRDSLLQTGLDHLMIIVNPSDDKIWAVIQSALEADIFTTVHMTITTQNQTSVMDYLQRLPEMGLRSISLSATDVELKEQLRKARERAAELHLSLVWDLPVPYSALNPFSLEFADHERTIGAGHSWLYVEPDGDVLPGQGINQVLGNFLTDPFDKIWKPI